ncbi:MAG: tetratricopeptide repeat protein [Oscillospiraceae bacterium]|nr:tetratricopeptide repeat protein [Oscillospiraceae bacterium]MBQ2384481.1 tetratricopeptide repeat protein [Oscillospiraceae bacterium]MBQ5711101.1 tetratricopeptide repeat protein [Oscillospiraceae bacterium]
MAKKYSCFVISPIGESGSPTRRDADFLLNLIIAPTLKEFGFDVMRGDHRSEANQIDIDVIKSVQESDLCICNLSEPNINVYYELGRRDETGKPVVLMKSKQSANLPVDIATRRYIEFDLTDPQGILDAMTQLRNFVAPLVEKGLEHSSKAASLYEIAEILQRVERKLDRAMTQAPVASTPAATVSTGTAAETDDGLTPFERMRLALIQKNIPAAEAAMEQLQYRMDKMRFYDVVVEQVAAIGSRKAGQMLVDFAQEFIDSDMSFKKKTEYLGCLVSYASRTDTEMQIIDLVERICAQLEGICEDEDPGDVVQIYNQPNRLYYGIYATTSDETWLDKAIEALQKALRITQQGFLYFNLALCVSKKRDYEAAARYAEKCLEFDEQANKEDVDHLELACEMYYRISDPKFQDTFSKLQNVSSGKAMLLMRKLRNL